jgi:hypothetical protein
VQKKPFGILFQLGEAQCGIVVGRQDVREYLLHAFPFFREQPFIITVFFQDVDATLEGLVDEGIVNPGAFEFLDTNRAIDFSIHPVQIFGREDAFRADQDIVVVEEALRQGELFSLCNLLTELIKGELEFSHSQASGA